MSGEDRRKEKHSRRASAFFPFLALRNGIFRLRIVVARDAREAWFLVRRPLYRWQGMHFIALPSWCLLPGEDGGGPR